jgi:tetratricopeptide (TPR) repeat protein
MANFAESVEEHVAITAQALQLAQQHDDPYLILLCMKEMAGSYENEGYYADSLPCRAQALQLAYEIQDAYQIGEAHYLHGLIHAHVGLFETAIEHFQRALALAQAHNVIWLERRTLNRLARSHYCLGQLDTAHAFSLQVQKICRPGDELPSFFDFTYAQILAAFNRWAEAERAYQQILTRKRGDKMTAATILLPELAALAQLALQQGKFQHALGYVEEILAIERSHPQRFMPNLYFDAYAIDVACYKVLHALHDWRAPSLLAASYQHLCTRVEQIADQRLRHAYLENVAANRALHEAYVHTLSIEEQARAAVIVGR